MGFKDAYAIIYSRLLQRLGGGLWLLDTVCSAFLRRGLRALRRPHKVHGHPTISSIFICYYGSLPPFSYPPAFFLSFFHSISLKYPQQHTGFWVRLPYLGFHLFAHLDTLCSSFPSCRMIREQNLWLIFYTKCLNLLKMWQNIFTHIRHYLILV